MLLHNSCQCICGCDLRIIVNKDCFWHNFICPTMVHTMVRWTIKDIFKWTKRLHRFSVDPNHVHLRQLYMCQENLRRNSNDCHRHISELKNKTGEQDCDSLSHMCTYPGGKRLQKCLSQRRKSSKVFATVVRLMDSPYKVDFCKQNVN